MGSHEGRAVSGECDSGDGESGCRVLDSRAASFLFFEEDVLKG